MSDSEDDSQKTEDPTPKKLEESRRKGQVAISREINNWVMIVAGTLVILAMGPSMMRDMAVLLRTYFEMAYTLPSAPGGMEFLVVDVFKEVLKILALPLLFLLAAAFLGPYLQVGPLFAPEIIKMDLSKISIMKGFSRLFSMKSVMEFVKGVLKISIISVVGFLILSPFFGSIEHLIGLPVAAAMDEIATLTSRLLIGIIVVLFIIAALDLLYQRYEHMKKMRMSQQEVKDEYRQSEGDPHVKAKLRQLRQEKARARMMQAVPTADVIITNPTHYSVALKYDPEVNDAPIVVAKGVDDLALRIREVARENDIMIMPNPPLARVLFDTVEIDELVPPDQYKAVAEIISYVFKLKGKLKQ